MNKTLFSYTKNQIFYSDNPMVSKYRDIKVVVISKEINFDLDNLISKACNVQKIYLFYLNSFPYEILNWKKLSKIVVMNCFFKKICHEKEVNANIRSLEILNTPVDDFPSINFSSLKTLILRGSNIIQIPDEISRLKSLIHLDLSGNAISSIDPSFCDLNHLQFLSLHENLLRDIPENIGKLRKLKHCVLRNNALKRIPVSFTNLKKLNYLNVRSNQISTIMEIILRLNIKHIDITNNPLEQNEIDILKRFLKRKIFYV